VFWHWAVNAGIVAEQPWVWRLLRRGGMGDPPRAVGGTGGLLAAPCEQLEGIWGFML